MPRIARICTHWFALGFHKQKILYMKSVEACAIRGNQTVRTPNKLLQFNNLKTVIYEKSDSALQL